MKTLKKSHFVFTLYRNYCKNGMQKIKQKFRKCKKRRERMSRSKAGNKMLPEYIF